MTWTNNNPEGFNYYRWVVINYAWGAGVQIPITDSSYELTGLTPSDTVGVQIAHGVEDNVMTSETVADNNFQTLPE